MWKDLSEEQKTALTVMNDSREIDGVDQGVARYRRSLLHVEVGKPEEKLIRRHLTTLTQAIEVDQQAMLAGAARPGRPSTWGASYIGMDAERMALITMTTLFNLKDAPLTQLALRVADRVKLEHEFDEIRRLNRNRDKDQKGFSRNFSNRLNSKDKVRDLYKRLTADPLRWTPTHRIGIGTRLIKLAIEATGLWSTTKVFSSGKTIIHVEVSESVMDLIVSGHSEMELMRLVYHPMCCPPLDWKVVDNAIVGGYRLQRSQFVRDWRGDHPTDYTEHDVSRVLDALNAIQAVEWRIDERILGLADALYKTNSSQFDNAIKYLSERPRIPPFNKDATEAERKTRRQVKEQLKADWQAAASVRIAQLQAISTARQCVDQPVYFPHNLDWRGRVYPQTTFLSPQGFDLQKALLRYAEKLPIGPTGMDDMKIAAAGHAGVDKVSFEDRIKWFDSQYPDPTKFDPLEDLRWVDYDSPFLFVQLIQEISDAVKSGLGEHFLSDVSACVDGSQNGLQHLSAIGRDAIGGRAVNLIDAEVPADLYADVSDIVYTSILGDQEHAVASGQVADELGEPLPPLVWPRRLEVRKARRSVVKRSVLAYPYGVTKAGMRDGLIADGHLSGVEGSRHRNAWYLAEKIDGAVRSVVINAAMLMDWFRSVADASAAENKSIKWVAPSGFPVNMHYFVQTSREIRTCLGRLHIRETRNRDSVDGPAQVRGIVANFIHSLDASHLVLTVLKAVSLDYRSFHFVHDSYGCHVGRIRELGVVLRDEFVTMHESNPLNDFANGLEIEVTDPPKLGNLDLNSVKSSKFFFA